MTTAPSTVAELAERSRRSLSIGRGLLRQLETVKPPFDEASLLRPLDELLLALANLEGDANLFSQVHPQLDVRTTAEDVLRQAQALRMILLQNRRIYAALGALDRASLPSLAWRTATLLRQDMRRAGVELSEAQRDRIHHLRGELVDIEQAFARNIRADVRHIQLTGPEELDGLPPDYITAHPPGPDGRIRITTEYPDYYPFMSYAHSDRARVALLDEFYNRAAPPNLDVLGLMLSKRHELATLLGYASWADYATENQMAQSARNATAFLERIKDSAHSAAQAELAVLLEFKRRDHPSAETVGLWESQYYQQCVKAERFAFDARTVRPYFAYQSVKQAILDLSGELFGLRFTPVAEASSWHPSVETFDVAADGETIGRISLDMHPRAGKYTHASCCHWRIGVAGRQLPHVVLICNFPDPATRKGPALLDHQEVVVFFHEFGHLVHGLVRGKAAWVRLAHPGERDFIEAPSQLLEEWTFDFDVLRRFARHVDTGDPIPRELVAGLRSAREFGQGLYAQWLVFRSVVSLALHDGDSHRLDTTSLVFELAQRYLLYELPAATRFEASFEHLRNYTATYYSYLWSQAIARDLLDSFDKSLLDLAQTRRYRDLVLAPGGSKPAAELLADFLGRQYSCDAYASWLAHAQRSG